MFRTPWRQSLCWWLLAAAGLLAVYAPALHGGFVWDDDVHISDNEALRSGLGLARIWFEPGAVCQYYPLSFSAFWLEYHLWGLDPLGYHVVNVLLHAAVAVLLWQVLKRLRVPGAGLAAAIFALHPVMVMSVAWMTELKNTLSASLALGAIWAYLRFARVGVYAEVETSDVRRQRSEVRGQKPEDRGQRVEWGFYLLALGLFQLAMFAKTAVSFVPVTLLLILWWRRPRLRWADFWPLLPMLAIIAVMGRITAQVERSTGAMGAEFAQTFPERVLIAGRSFWFYLGKLVWPTHLTFIYPRWDVDAVSGRQWLFPLAAGLLMAGLWRARGWLGKAPLVAALHFFLCTSALILGMSLYMTRYSFVADHWQYLGAMGACALVGAALARGLARFGRAADRTIAGLLLLGLAGASWRQSQTFANAETLWRATLDENPNCAMAYDNLGVLLLHTGRFSEAAGEFVQALRLAPGNAADLHDKLGATRLQLRHPTEAVVEFEQAVLLRPDVADFHNNLAGAQVALGDFEPAIEQYKTALRLQPGSVAAQVNLAATLLEAHRPAEALPHAVSAVDLEPDDPTVRCNLGNVLRGLGRTADSIPEYKEALRLRPDYPKAHLNLGLSLLELGRGAEAMPEFEAALRLEPDNFSAHNNLGLALAQAGRMTAATVQFEAALRLRPGAAATHCNLAKVYLLTARPSEAITQLEEALQLQSDYPEARALLSQARGELPAGGVTP